MLAITQLECVRGERRLFGDLSFTAAPHTLLKCAAPTAAARRVSCATCAGCCRRPPARYAWCGTDIHALGDEYRAQLAYLGHLSGVKDELTAAENLCFSAGPAGLPADAAAIDAALETLGISECRHLPCKALSQGQRRRVALARLALSAARPLWVLDEPFTALDTAALAVVRHLVEAHLDRGGIVVLTTHQEVAIAARATQRVELDR